jgi:hypothetical protein
LSVRDYIINIIGIVFEARSDGKKLQHAPEKAADAMKLHHESNREGVFYD